ncbi:DUF1592 domain-containing protein [bacterium]|nr:DUF1592 domain-containing protein [bacterium]
MIVSFLSFRIPITLPPFLCLIALASFTISAEPLVQLPQKHLPLLENYCFDCHDTEVQKGKVDLETLPLYISTIEQAELWQKVLNAVNSGEMPPENKRQPDSAVKTDFLDALAQTMVAARRSLSDTGGKITMRRLNRREYRNSIKDLTGVKLDVSNLPSDGGVGSFDTMGTSQYISSDQVEQYLKLGRTAVDEVFERRTTEPAKQSLSFRVEPEKTVNVASAKAMRQMEEAYDRFMRWKAGVDKAAAAPENRRIMANILRENPKFDLSAFPAASGFLFYRQAHKLIGAPDPKKFGFRDDNAATFSFQGGYSRKYAYLKHYAELPHSDRGTYLKLTWGIQRIDVLPPKMKLVPGTYRLGIRAGAVEGSPPSRHFIELGHPQRVNGVPAGFAGHPISSHHVTGTIQQPEIIETLLEVGVNTQREFAIQEKQPANKQGLRNAYNKAKQANGFGIVPAIWIDWVELEGPLAPSLPQSDANTGLSQILADNLNGGSELERARNILTDFSVSAFRQAQPEPRFIDQLLALFQTRRSAGDSFDVAIRTPLSVILASPGFLYLNEPGDETDRRKLTDRELAVRLSYFLWSAPPDQQLLALAGQNKLCEPKALRQQVDRLIADPRADEFVAGFVHQWLDMERLDFFQFDVTLHGEFDESVRSAARQEVYQSFAHLLRDNDGWAIGKLLKSDYVLINGLLAVYYGIDGVTGDPFQKVILSANSPRGGLLGMAAIHAMGSDGVHSSPVERGPWVLRHLLHDPPPPAPPNVPQLSRLAGKPFSKLEKLAAHQEEPQCASCHRKIDPIGFGLENFTAAGKWRSEERQFTRDTRGRTHISRNALPIDASGRFHKGPAFTNYDELRNLIAQREADFARGFTEHLIEYALGRLFGFIDENLSDEIVTASRSKQYAVSEFIHALVQSKPFQTK